MATNTSNENDTSTNNYSSEFSLPPSIRFLLLIIFDIPSLTCSFYLLYYLITDRNLRKALNNHAIVVLLFLGLFSQLIDIPFYLNYLRIGYVWPQINFSCILWWFAATGISNIINLIMAWASIERHILVFHDRYLLTTKHRFWLHYFPLLILLLYGFSYYIIILLIYPCENMYAYTYDWCFYPCYYDNENLAFYDTIINSIVPIPIIIIFNILLIIRVLKQKQILHQRFQWRKYRKIIIQLLSISGLFLFFNLPMTCLVLAHVCGLPDGGAGQFEDYTYYLYHFITLLLPFVCLMSSSEIRKKLNQINVFKKRTNTVGLI